MAGVRHRISVQNKENIFSDYMGEMNKRGSSAKTPRGALRFHRANIAECIAGIKLLREWKSCRVHSPARKIDFDTRYNRSHVGRKQKRASAIYKTLAAETPVRRLDLCTTVCPGETLDLRQAVVAMTIAEVESEIAEMLWDCWPYRYSTSSWAGGEHSVKVRLTDAPTAFGESERVWSANRKWSGSNSSAKLGITARCLRELGTGLVIGGLLTLDAERIGPREYKAVWVEQGRGFGLKVVQGWLIRGHHVTGGTEMAARRKVSAARTARRDTLLAARSRYRMGADCQDLASVTVTLDDSLVAGNCRSGTSSFVKRFESQIAGRSAVSGAELLAWRDDNYTRAALSAALGRTQSEKR
ncbi:hypothetical protein PQR75_46795 [Paraburkholderia fungorum]|uniref:hypothetical protein n=1 Tax=Paraburkholderia fungorum TaxID=134537 RepID=UPI0038B9B77D